MMSVFGSLAKSRELGLLNQVLPIGIRMAMEQRVIPINQSASVEINDDRGLTGAWSEGGVTLGKSRRRSVDVAVSLNRSSCIEVFPVEEIHAISHVRHFQAAAERLLSSVGAQLPAGVVGLMLGAKHATSHVESVRLNRRDAEGSGVGRSGRWQRFSRVLISHAGDSHSDTLQVETIGGETMFGLAGAGQADAAIGEILNMETGLEDLFPQVEISQDTAYVIPSLVGNRREDLSFFLEFPNEEHVVPIGGCVVLVKASNLTHPQGGALGQKGVERWH
ncbi:hypothetical protein NE237_000993 [Protea cynaroides]|uniref:Uncharacterized protein n=1 Tax=Protea cynaroides TaxID=273540 RepID=A0A9Q0KSG5_9MAGN|nr:hypothetical protein NE237_000993 [Protea cynaroides]